MSPAQSRSQRQCLLQQRCQQQLCHQRHQRLPCPRRQCQPVTVSHTWVMEWLLGSDNQLTSTMSWPALFSAEPVVKAKSQVAAPLQPIAVAPGIVSRTLPTCHGRGFVPWGLPFVPFPSTRPPPPPSLQCHTRVRGVCCPPSSSPLASDWARGLGEAAAVALLPQRRPRYVVGSSTIPSFAVRSALLVCFNGCFNKGTPQRRVVPCGVAH